MATIPGQPVVSEHKESVYIGYRYYDTAEKEVQFPFGYGLSYTTFEYSDLELSSSNIKDTDDLTVTFNIKNTGSVDGAEIAEFMWPIRRATIFRPKKDCVPLRKCPESRRGEGSLRYPVQARLRILQCGAAGLAGRDRFV